MNLARQVDGIHTSRQERPDPFHLFTHLEVAYAQDDMQCALGERMCQPLDDLGDQRVRDDRMRVGAVLHREGDSSALPSARLPASWADAFAWIDHPNT